MAPEHKMPISWQRRHVRATVSAGPTQYQAQGPLMLATGPVRYRLAQAEADADALERAFRGCPMHQWGAAAQAAMSMRGC